MTTPAYKMRYQKSEKGRAKRLARERTPEVRAKKLAWGREKGLVSRRESQRKYRGTEKFLTKKKKYSEKTAEWGRSEAGQRSRRKARGQPEPTRPRPNRCECCGTYDLLLPKPLCLDHCHTTGAFRGWICDSCNVGIGRLNDNAEGVRKALHYLEKFECESQ